MKKWSLLLVFIFWSGASLVLAAKPYKIGALFSITGPTSFIGEPERNTLVMLIEKINKAGGINGHPLQAIIYDTEGDETNTLKKATKLIIQDKVLAIIGPSRTGTTLALIPFVERYKVPLISCAAGIKIVEPVRPWVFKTAQSDRLAVKKLYAYCKRHGIKRIAIITVSNGFGQSGREELKHLAPEYGLEIVADEIFGPKDVDMSPQLIRIRAKGPDAVICWGTNPGPAIVAKNMRQLGMKQPLFMSHGVASKRFIELAGKASEGVILPAGKILVAQQLPKNDPQRALLLRYLAEYKARYGKEPLTFGGHAYDALLLLKQALEKAGADRNKIRQALEHAHIVGIHGIFRISPKDHNGLDPKEAFVLVRIQHGKWVMVKD